MSKPLAIVTGASSGIGYNLAKVFAENGFDLIIGSNSSDLEQAERDFRDLGVTVTAVEADLATYDGVEELWKAVEATGRSVEAAAINAGIGVGGLFAETDLDTEINIVRLNVESTVHLSKRVVQHMLKRGTGKILITSSIAGEMVAPRLAVYSASKAFDLSFAKSLRAELEDTGITVTALQPGPTETNFFHRADMDDMKLAQDKDKHSDPYDVAKQGFEALMKGEKHVYAANASVKFQGAMANFVPDSVKASMHKKETEPVHK
jgi:short-subunit dehydrogenase